jgi:hypothetical protein
MNAFQRPKELDLFTYSWKYPIISGFLRSNRASVRSPCHEMLLVGEAECINTGEVCPNRIDFDHKSYPSIDLKKLANGELSIKDKNFSE